MNRIAIDRMNLSLDGFDAEAAQGVEHALPDVLSRRLERRLVHGDSLRLNLGNADLGALSVSNSQDPRVVAEAIASRFVDWLDGQETGK